VTAICYGTTRKGNRCRMSPMRGQDYCVNHRPGADRAEAASLAGIASGRARRPPTQDLMHTVFSLTDRASIQALIDTVIRLLLAGRLNRPRAHVILRACNIAIANFDRTADTLTGPKPQQHEWGPYFTKVQSILATIDPLLDQPTTPDEDDTEDPYA
jgi:hypothetical protein